MGPTSPVVYRPALRGDEARLFRIHHRRLLRLVARDVSARPEVIEDACAFAWSELVARQPERINVVGWLRVVARHEAVRLAEYDRRIVSLTPKDQDRRAAHAYRSRVEAGEALGLVAALPLRERAVLALQVSDHSYRETAERLQMAERTVERQLLRAARRCAANTPQPSTCTLRRNETPCRPRHTGPARAPPTLGARSRRRTRRFSTMIAPGPFRV